MEFSKPGGRRASEEAQRARKSLPDTGQRWKKKEKMQLTGSAEEQHISKRNFKSRLHSDGSFSQAPGHPLVTAGTEKLWQGDHKFKPCLSHKVSESKASLGSLEKLYLQINREKG